MLILSVVLCAALSATPVKNFDVVVYGATPSGIAAAISYARADKLKKIAVVESSSRIGGMSSPGGIGLRDWGMIKPCCTMQEWGFLNAVHYNVSYPVWQPDNHVGEANFLNLLKTEPNIQLFTNEAVQQHSVVKNPATKRITSFTTASTMWTASFFIDSSYEGLLIREAATTTFGRESAIQYNETYAGARQPGKPAYKYPISSKWDNGTLLKWVNGDAQPAIGEADKGVMGWSFRACVTTNKKNQVPFPKPVNYDPEDFELMKRYLASLNLAGTPPTMGQLFGVYNYRSYPPADKWDLCDNDNSPVTSDVVDDAIESYINGTHSDRETCYNKVKYYVQGYLYFLANDASVPTVTQASALKYGLCADEWPDNGHFPPQLYVREALRVVGDDVFTQNKWMYDTTNESVGLGGWGIDIHVVHRRSNGDNVVFDEGFFSPGTGNKAFKLPFSLVLPKKDDVVNLMSTSVLSCTHVTWACLREEPTLWLLGMAAGTSLSLLSGNQSVFDVSIHDLQVALKAQGVQLEP
eukprot:TRINITY_DN37816_c0_g1_i1.p1 TRINITY_DN37816_c0_g1~~TRINITY_DN37816_c0_g1_i1.p1  ORF type:complete len:541 (+),score=78.12 TRINITY_DN37816_c0_g1_i1:57-1625(+)